MQGIHILCLRRGRGDPGEGRWGWEGEGRPEERCRGSSSKTPLAGLAVGPSCDLGCDVFLPALGVSEREFWTPFTARIGGVGTTNSTC